MGTYKILRDTKNGELQSIDVFGYDQSFSKEDRESLWNEHSILYLGDIMAVWVEERECMEPLIHLMGEDDGHIFWYRARDTRFSAYWINDYIDTLKELKIRLKTKDRLK